MMVAIAKFERQLNLFKRDINFACPFRLWTCRLGNGLYSVYTPIIHKYIMYAPQNNQRKWVPGYGNERGLSGGVIQ